MLTHIQLLKNTNKTKNLIQFTQYYHLSFLYNLFYTPYLLKRRV